jgi:hypothetical protein
MAKFYYPTPDEVRGDRPLSERVWFQRFQRLLVRLANTAYGRDILCLDSWSKMPYPVVRISKNLVTFYLGCWEGRHHWLSDCRVGAKWANVVRSRWQVVRNAMARMEFWEMQAWPNLTGNRLAAARFTHVTFHPDADTESTTVDGIYGYAGADDSWANVYAHAGNQVGDSDPEDACPVISTGGSSGDFDILRVGCFLFDTAAIPDGDSKDSGTFSLFGTAIADTLSQTVRMTKSAPASNTELAATDFQNRVHTMQSDTSIAFGSFSASGYNDFALNAAGLTSVQLDGVTKFGCECLADNTNTAPSHASETTAYVSIKFADQSGDTNDPKLVVVHSISAAVAWSAAQPRGSYQPALISTGVIAY